ncbi:MAG: hypothetical protein LBR66_06940 [Candidatus Symbiothrix sp.]|jgi:site-specific DNA-methyltransferase (adenine-specific)|nr:hypothetical protein [Candidatus Symbiothrix sp.]
MKEYKIEETEINSVMEPIVAYIAENKATKGFKPVFKTSDTALYNEDCLKIMARFPDDYVDMIFADPPYNLSNGGITCHAGKMVSVNKGKWDKSDGFENDVDFYEQMFVACLLVLNFNKINYELNIRF